ncbi:MAG: hypothetical protein ACJA13_004129 [Paraglaciecola sp.]
MIIFYDIFMSQSGNKNNKKSTVTALSKSNVVKHWGRGLWLIKLSVSAEMLPVTWPKFGWRHPFDLVDQAQG